jgi:hypothetical protein
MATTSPVRVPEVVRGEVLAAARLLGCNAAELLERAWESFRRSPEFVEEFDLARKAFSVGDLDIISTRLHAQGVERAQQRAAAVQAMRH